MRIQSPLSNLRNVLAQVKETAVTYQSAFSNNEAATRLALIDPVLTALGWDMSNPSMVVVENTAQSYRADYVLYDSGQSAKIVVEAKSLGANVFQGRPQLFATVARIQQGSQQKIGFVTNGLVWEHYTGQTSLTNHTLTWSGNIASDDLQVVAAHLIQYLDAAQFWPQEDNIAPELSKLQDDYADINKRISALEQGVAIVSPKPPPSTLNWIDLDDLPSNPNDMANTTPSHLRLPDGSEKKVGSWAYALLTACETTLNSNPNIPLPLLDNAGASKALISNVKIPRSTSLLLGNGATVFVHLNYQSGGSVANIKHILKFASNQNVKPAVVYATK